MPRVPNSGTRRRLLSAGVVALIVAAVATVGGFAFHQVAPLGSTAAPTKRGGFSETEPVAFDTIDPMSKATWDQHWTMQPLADGNGWTVLAAESTRVWFLRGVPAEGERVQFSGHWAEYTDESARVFRYGSLSGTGFWLPRRVGMTLSLEFESGQDASRWLRPITLKLSETQSSPSQTLERIELADYIQPILYREVTPRGLPWADSIEDQLVGWGARRLTIPFVDSNQQYWKLDGNLDEESWRSIRLNPQETTGVSSSDNGATQESMRLYYSQEGLHIGLQVREKLTAPRIVADVLTRFGLPARHSSWYTVHIESDSVVSSRYTAHEREMPWECTWKAATKNSGKEWQAEIMLPFDGLNEGRAPVPGERWRLCLRVYDALDAEDAVVAGWGTGTKDVPEPYRVLRGMIVTFDEP